MAVRIATWPCLPVVSRDNDVTYNDDGSLTVTDTDASDGDDGTDTLTGIETLRFADGDVDVNEAPVDIEGTAPLAVSESASPGDAVGTIIVTDLDADDTHIFELTDDAGGLFSHRCRDRCGVCCVRP